MPVRIERASLLDLDDIVRLERACFPSPWTRDSFRRELSRTDDVAVYLMARDGDEPVGYAGMWVVGGEAHVATIGVRPDRRRQSIGARILLRLLAEAARRGADRVFLEFRRSNRAAQQLYAKYGFVETGIRRQYYVDNLEDAVIAEITDLQDEAMQVQIERWRRALAAAEVRPT